MIAGCQGLHCDLSGTRFHPIYGWGRGNLVFEDLDNLIAALKKIALLQATRSISRRSGWGTRRKIHRGADGSF